MCVLMVHYVIFFLIVLIFFTFVCHEESFIIFNALATPDKILPEWFFLPIFGIIKAIPNQAVGLFGVVYAFFVTFFSLGNRQITVSKSTFFLWGVFLCGFWVVFGFWGVVVVLVFPHLPAIRSILLLLFLFFFNNNNK